MLTAEVARERLQDMRRDLSRITENVSRVSVAVSVARNASPEHAMEQLAEADAVAGNLANDTLYLYKKIIMLHDQLMPEQQTLLL
jgi:hypothetical protein